MAAGIGVSGDYVWGKLAQQSVGWQFYSIARDEVNRKGLLGRVAPYFLEKAGLSKAEEGLKVIASYYDLKSLVDSLGSPFTQKRRWIMLYDFPVNVSNGLSKVMVRLCKWGVVTNVRTKTISKTVRAWTDLMASGRAACVAVSGAWSAVCKRIKANEIDPVDFTADQKTALNRLKDSIAQMVGHVGSINALVGIHKMSPCLEVNGSKEFIQGVKALCAAQKTQLGNVLTEELIGKFPYLKGEIQSRQAEINALYTDIDGLAEGAKGELVSKVKELKGKLEALKSLLDNPVQVITYTEVVVKVASALNLIAAVVLSVVGVAEDVMGKERFAQWSSLGRIRDVVYPFFFTIKFANTIPRNYLAKAPKPKVA